MYAIINNIRNLKKRDIAILMGDIIDYFDVAIYGLLVPIIAPKFFPTFEPIMQLILSYSVSLTAIIAKPLGTIIFGSIARKRTPFIALMISLLGISITSILIGFLPTYHDIGIIATMLLVTLRFLQSVFATGEPMIAALYLLEDKPANLSKTLSYLYQSGAAIGMLLASFAVSLVVSSNNPDIYWRIPFIVAGIISLIGVFFRKNIFSQKINNSIQEINNVKKESMFKLLWLNKKQILIITLPLLFLHTGYSLSFSFMNVFVPQVNKTISYENMIWLSTILLFFDAVLVQICGVYLIKFSITKIMINSALALAFIIIPIFVFLDKMTMTQIVIARFMIVAFTVSYTCYFNYWVANQFNSNDKYLLAGMSNAIAQMLCRNNVAICLALWHFSHLSIMPAIYIAAIAVISVSVLILEKNTL